MCVTKAQCSTLLYQKLVCHTSVLFIMCSLCYGLAIRKRVREIMIFGGATWLFVGIM